MSDPLAVEDMAELSVLAGEDVWYVVDDPDGAPLGRKVSARRAGGMFLAGGIGGRLTLASGYPYPEDLFLAQKTPSATSTSLDTCDFAAAHGWPTGTVVTPDSSGGGLVTGTRYYVRAVDSNTVSFHLTAADAFGNTNLVNLESAISSQLTPAGLASTTLYFSPLPDRPAYVTLFDGTRWVWYRLAERSLALSALSVGRNYDVFLYAAAHVLTLELSAAWTDSTTRANALTTQDNFSVKAGQTSRLWLGTIRATETSATEDVWGYAIPSGTGTVCPRANHMTPKAFVWNRFNQRARWLQYGPRDGYYSISGGIVQRRSNRSTSQVEWVTGLQSAPLVEWWGISGQPQFNHVNLDVSAATASTNMLRYAAPSSYTPAQYRPLVAAGYHYVAWSESSPASSLYAPPSDTATGGVMLTVEITG